MIPWTTVFNRFGFSLSYLRNKHMTFGIAFSFNFGDSFFAIGKNPVSK